MNIGTGSLSTLKAWRNGPKPLESAIFQPIEKIASDSLSRNSYYSSSATLVSSRPRVDSHPEEYEKSVSSTSSRDDINAQAAIANALSPAQIKLRGMVHRIFEDMQPENVEGMRSLADDVCETLTSLEIGPDELQEILENVKSADNRTAILIGGASALGFIGGGYAWMRFGAMLKAIFPASTWPYLPGSLTGIIDRLLSKFLADIHPGYDAAPDRAMLAEAMQEYLAHHQRPLFKELIDQAGALSAPYTIRNVVRSGAAPLAAHYGLTGEVDFGIDGLGGLAAGACVQGLRNANDMRDGIGHHPAYFLGRTDLGNKLNELRAPLRHKIMRSIHGIYMGSSNIPTSLVGACKSLLTLESMTEISLLAVGFACNDWFKETAEEEFKGASPEASAFVKNTAGTAFLLTLYCSLSLAMTGAGKLKQRLMTTHPAPDPQPAENAQRY